jgi:hypothetical protein
MAIDITRRVIVYKPIKQWAGHFCTDAHFKENHHRLIIIFIGFIGFIGWLVVLVVLNKVGIGFAIIDKSADCFAAA